MDRAGVRGVPQVPRCSLRSCPRQSGAPPAGVRGLCFPEIPVPDASAVGFSRFSLPPPGARGGSRNTPAFKGEESAHRGVKIFIEGHRATKWRRRRFLHLAHGSCPLALWAVAWGSLSSMNPPPCPPVSSAHPLPPLACPAPVQTHLPHCPLRA